MTLYKAQKLLRRGERDDLVRCQHCAYTAVYQGSMEVHIARYHSTPTPTCDSYEQIAYGVRTELEGGGPRSPALGRRVVQTSQNERLRNRLLHDVDSARHVQVSSAVLGKPCSVLCQTPQKQSKGGNHRSSCVGSPLVDIGYWSRGEGRTPHPPVPPECPRSPAYIAGTTNGVADEADWRGSLRAPQPLAQLCTEGSTLMTRAEFVMPMDRQRKVVSPRVKKAVRPKEEKTVSPKRRVVVVERGEREGKSVPSPLEAYFMADAASVVVRESSRC